MVKVKTVATESPEFFQETKDTIPLLERWLEDQDQRYIRKAVKIFEGAQVDKRYAIMPPKDVFTKFLNKIFKRSK